VSSPCRSNPIAFYVIQSDSIAVIGTGPSAADGKLAYLLSITAAADGTVSSRAPLINSRYRSELLVQ